jgi:hypothetical protein
MGILSGLLRCTFMNANDYCKISITGCLMRIVRMAELYDLQYWQTWEFYVIRSLVQPMRYGHLFVLRQILIPYRGPDGLVWTFELLVRIGR